MQLMVKNGPHYLDVIGAEFPDKSENQIKNFWMNNRNRGLNILAQINQPRRKRDEDSGSEYQESTKKKVLVVVEDRVGSSRHSSQPFSFDSSHLKRQKTQDE